MKKNNKKLAISGLLIAIISITILIGVCNPYGKVELQENTYNLALNNITAETKKVFLSDLDYITDNNWSYNGWSGHTIQKDKNQEGGALSLIINGEKRFFIKGVSVHAKGQVTYDIGELSTKYPRFLAYIGVDASRGTNGSVWFRITASKDGVKWDRLIDKSDVLTGNSNAVEIDLNIEGYKYLCIYFDPNGGNAADHGTIADARLVPLDFDKESVAYNKIHKLEYYDELLRAHDAEYNYNHNYRQILEREFVRKIGYWNIQNIAEFNPSILPTIEWIFSDNVILEQIIEVGNINDANTFLDVLSKLYETYKEELKTANGAVYQKMMIALATAYSTDLILSPLSFNNYTRTYDPLERFRLYKQLYDTDKLLHKDWFDNYHMELMRTIMQDGVKNDELLWLNNYIYQYKNGALGPYSYMGYVQPHYARPEFFNPDNKEKYNNKYHFLDYNVPYGGTPSNRNDQRYWMVFEAGGICWGISRTGSSISRTVGLPSTGLYQPDHEVYLFYEQDANGNGFWSLGNNIFGWGKSSTTWYGGNRTRLIFNWGAKYFADEMMSNKNYGTSSGYMYLGQANLNNLEVYRKSLYYNLLANSYEDNETKLDIYNQALAINNINLDSYDYKINMYKALNKTSAEWKTYAEEIIAAYKFYPQAMYDLLKVIKPYLNEIDTIDIELQEHAALEEASHATKNDIWQDLAARELANALLGKDNKAEIASFSFDGENAGKIVINSAYDEYSFAWYYSLDGGKTLSPVITDHSVELTLEEIASITAENDIQIAIQGLGDLKPDYTIDIKKGVVSTNLFANDLENRVIGVNSTYEWRNSEDEEWKSYAEVLPDNTGDKTLHVRVGATGCFVPSDSVTYTFTEDNQPDTRKYVSVAHLSIAGVSSQATGGGQNGHAINALDGNYNTRWHSAWDGSDTKRFITIKLDEPKYVSSVEFVPAGGGNGKIIDGTVWGSVDGENWIELSTQTNLSYTNKADSLADAILNTKDFAILDPVKVQYIKIEAKRASNGNWFTAREFNIYEDKTIVKVADFSFDGENGGKISLEEDYQGRTFQYSIDGGATWKSVKENSYALSKEEINQINEENGIKIKLDGEEKEHLINIRKGEDLTLSPYVNDLENRLIGLNDVEKLEWKIEDGEWTSYQEQEPIVIGTKKLYVRRKATRNVTASNTLMYNFTEDNQPNTRKYIPIKHLSIHSYSTQSIDTGRPFYAPNAIDGNVNTLWHTDFRYSVLDSEIKPFITIKLDQSKNLSAVEFIQTKYR
ncbi:MAG: hypothetical protein HFI09_03135, partial [Bacilli bacterium]|nr:hypothetical protein [Bacilli bacterium]